MRDKILPLLVLPIVCGWVLPCEARNNPSSRPSEQRQDLPAFTPKAEPPFVLPPLDQSNTRVKETTGVKVTLKRVVFSGNTVFDDSALQAVAAAFLNRAVDVGELEELRFRLTQHYIKNGYVNSGAVIPSQNFSDGELKVELIEGKLSEVNIDGNGWLHPDYLRDRLLDDQPFNAQTFQERYLRLLNDPLIEHLNGNLKPLPQPGMSALDLHVTRARPYQLAVHFNNYNPPSVGAEQMQVEAWVRNLTRWGDKFDFRYDASEGASVYAGGLSMPLNASGTLFDFHFETGRSSIVEEPLNKANITSEVTNFTWTLSHPFYQSIDQNLTLGVSFASRHNQTGLLDNPSFPFVRGLKDGRSKVTALRFFQDYNGRFEQQVLSARSTFSVGLSAFDSTTQDDPNNPDSRYFAWLGQLQHAWKVLDNGAQLRLRGNLQLSSEALLPQEQIAVGGVYSVRGYRENELVRDNGYSGSVEFHYPLWSMQGDYANQLTVFPFMDYGAAWNANGPTDHLHAVGVGVSWQGFKHIKADLYYAHDLRTATAKTTHDLQDDGIFFNVSLFAF